MAFTEIPSITVTCEDGSEDIYVGLNPNPLGDGNVEAFVDCFQTAAEEASEDCYDIPVEMILAQWGGESLWASGKTQCINQNWGNIIYSNSQNPPGNIGEGDGGWAKFDGLYKWAAGYLKKSSYYSSLVKYLQRCQRIGTSPKAKTCARYIANAGYGGCDHDAYYDGLVSWIKTVNKYL